MNNKQQNPVKKLLGIRGMGAALTAFVGLVIIYIAFYSRAVRTFAQRLDY